MQRREIIWISVLLILGILYVKYFSGWGVKPQMVIRVSQRATRRHRGPGIPTYFMLNDAFKLTSIEVIPLNGDKFNPLDRPVWHLITTSNSVPVRAFRYGQHIAGMKPAINVNPDPLTPGIQYRLLVTAGPVTGSVDFHMKPQD